MSTKSKVTVRALQPFVGSYKCALEEADVIHDETVEDDAGNIVKRKIARKKYAGFISVERQASVFEIEAAIEKRLPKNIEILGAIPKSASTPEGKPYPLRIRVHAAPVELPAEVAADLIARGLAEKVAA